MNQESVQHAGVPTATINERLIIPLLSFTVILVVMNTTMFNLALPQITIEFGLSALSASWIVTGYSIVFAISSITYTRLSDFLPIRKLFMIGLTSLSSASILGYFSHHFILLLCARLIQASGAASIAGLAIVLITRYIPLTRRGKAMSFIMSAVSLGLGLGPVIGGSITQYLGWNTLFAVTGITLLLLPVFFRLLPVEHARKGSFDLAGAMLIGIGTTGLLLFLTNRSLIMLAVSLVSLFLFWLRIHYVQSPFVQPALFRNKHYVTLSCLGIVPYINNFATLFLLPQILAHPYGLSPFQSGLIIFPGAILSVLASRRIGKTIDRFGNDLLMIYAPWLLTVAALLFATLAGLSFYAILAIYMLMSLGFTAITSSVSNELSRILPKEQIGAGMGLYQLTQFFSGTLSVAVSSSSLALQKDLPVQQAYSHIFWGMTAVAILAIACSWLYQSIKLKETALKKVEAGPSANT